MKIVLSKSGFLRGFVFITEPDHICIELIKLNGIILEVHRLTIEEDPVKPKMTGSSTSNKKESPIKNFQSLSEEIPVSCGEKIIRKQQGCIKMSAIP